MSKNKKKGEEVFDISLLIDNTIVRVPISSIKRNPEQPRTYFKKDSLIELANSFDKETKDVDNPIQVKPSVDKFGQRYLMIIDGERRFRAAKIAGFKEISCLIRKKELTDYGLLLKSTRLNLCAERMSPVEEALSIKKLMAMSNSNQSEVSECLGLNPSEVSQTLKYLKLHPKIQEGVINEEIDKGIALRITSFSHEDQFILLKELREATEEKGRPLGSNHANKLVAKISEKYGMKREKPKRGKKPMPHAELIVRETTRRCDYLILSIQEIVRINKDELNKLQGGRLTELTRIVNEAFNHLNVVREEVLPFLT